MLLLVFCAALASPAADAQFVQQRFLPQNGERGTLGEGQPLPMVVIGRRVMRLAPGAMIYDPQNRSIVQAQLPPSADIYYTKDANGDVQRIYILSEQEQTRLNQAGMR